MLDKSDLSGLLAPIKNDKNILSNIGNTPMRLLPSLNPEYKFQNIFEKCEYLNPGGSIKDRAAKYMITQAEQTGKLKPGGVIIEASSGNQGIALAMIGACKKYKVIITVPHRTSSHKVNLLKAYGAEVKICAEDGANGYVAVAKQIAHNTPNSYMPDQYYNPWNMQAHYYSTGAEIWQQSQGKVTHIIAAMGTGGTICGISKYLKQKNPKIQIWGADCATSARSIDIIKQSGDTKTLAYLKQLGAYQVEGIGVDVLNGLYTNHISSHPKAINKISTYTDQQIFAMAKNLAQNHGILVGLSSAAVLNMLYDNYDSFIEQDYIVTILADSGRSYLDKI